MMMMMKYETNTCHKFVTLYRVIKDGDDDNYDGEVANESVSQVCDTYSRYEGWWLQWWCWWWNINRKCVKCVALILFIEDDDDDDHADDEKVYNE